MNKQDLIAFVQLGKVHKVNAFYDQYDDKYSLVITLVEVDRSKQFGFEQKCVETARGETRKFRTLKAMCNFLDQCGIETDATYISVLNGGRV